MNSVLCKSLATAVLALGASASLAQTHQYQLNGSLADDFGGPSIVSNGGALGPTGYTFGLNQGLNTSGLGLSNVYTIDLKYHFDTHGVWQKIIDFSNLSLDRGMYTLGSQYNFYPVLSLGAAPADGVDGTLTLTRDAANVVNVYSNGSLSGSFLDSAGYANFAGNNASFFIDDFATGQGEAASGYVDYIRFWDTALSGAQVESLGAPTVSAVPEPETYAMMLAGLGLLGFAARRRKQNSA